MDQFVAGQSRPFPRLSAKALRAGPLAVALAASLAAAVAALLPVSAQAATTFQFAGKVAYATGEAPESVAAGDLNGDGKPDIVTANAVSNSVSVLINKGGGTFEAQVPYTTGTSPTGVAIADLNGDKKPDIVTANSGASTVSVLIGKGDGTFATKQDFATGTAPLGVAVADLNGDGKPDIVTANEGSNSVSVLINEGAGTFKAQVPYPTGTSPTGVAIADLNGDGKPDIVTANEGSNSVSVLINRGDGTFEAQVPYTTGTSPTGVAIADLNGDKKSDIVTANSGANTVSVLIGKGDGTFATKQDFATGTAPLGVAVADLNADGKPDIAVANSEANTASILLGKGDGTFAAKQDFATGTAPQAVALSDLNGDGKPDIVTANFAENSVTALLNTSVAALETSASSLSFPNTLFGTKSKALTVTVTNPGSAVLVINSVAVTGNFASSGCSGSSLSPGASCTLSVTFSPKGYGPLKGEATIASSAGSKVIRLSGAGLPPAPLVTTGPANEIVGTYVTLTGAVISQGPGTFYFQYGPTSSYGSVTPTLPLASNTLPQALASTLSLSPGATYHYRLVASNLQATVNGADHVFTIPPEAPLVKVLRHGRLASVLRHGLRLRLSDASHVVIKVRLLVDAQVARSAHLISAKDKRKKKVVVASARVTVAANRGKTVTIRFSAVARRKLAKLGRLKLTINATPATLSGVVGEAAIVSTRIRR
jgi:FG-GAP-like repeat/FG-GAP repeat